MQERNSRDMRERLALFFYLQAEGIHCRISIDLHENLHPSANPVMIWSLSNSSTYLMPRHGMAPGLLLSTDSRMSHRCPSSGIHMRFHVRVKDKKLMIFPS